MTQTGSDGLHLGQTVAPGGAATEPKLLEPAELTTHGVIVGMTGSGKTGLGLVLLEELLASGRPVIALDPKGDMGNLLLSFADLAPEQFEPWIDPAAATRESIPLAQLAARTAETWTSGLAQSGVSDQKRLAVAAAPKTLFTPGSTAGVPLSLLGSFAPPNLDWDSAEEVLRDEIEGAVSTLLILAGVEPDPVASREHILLATLVEHAWRSQTSLDLESLLAGILRPPFRKLGVLDLETFYPAEDRAALVGRLNGLLASPSFQPWLTGPTLDIDAALSSGARATVISIAHLTDAERMSVATLVLTKLVTWMRKQPGTGDLRALLYVDEMFGFAPPSAEPPSKKPLLTLMKTARAYGLGVVLATQNPMDLDYKAMSNAGTWMIGRLQTERDKARILEGLDAVGAGADLAALDATITGLAKRQFLHQSVRAGKPSVFATRWAISYLAGPLTLQQIRKLTAADPARHDGDKAAMPAATPSTSTADAPSTRPATDGESVVMPQVASGVAVRFADPASPWLPELGSATSGGATLVAALAATVTARFDDTASGVDHGERYELVVYPLDASGAPSSTHTVDFDTRDFVDHPPAGAVFLLPSAPVHQATFFKSAERELKAHIVGAKSVQVFRCVPLKSYSRVGEGRTEFEARMARLADDKADQEAAAERMTLEKKARALRGAVTDARQRLEEAQIGLEAQRREELIAGTGGVVGALFGGRLTTRGILSRARTAAAGSARERSQTQRAEARVGTLSENVAESDEELTLFEARILTTLAEIEQRWESAARNIEEVVIPPERTDIQVEDLALCWLPLG